MQKQKIKTQQIQKSNLIELIDTSYILDTEIKEKKKVLETNKTKLKSLSKLESSKSFSGELGECSFSDDTKTEIDPEAIYKLMVDLGIDNEFFNLVSVKIGDAREKIGDMALEKIWKQTIKKNNKIKFKKRS